MKFGKYLKENIVTEWTPHYIQYDRLKAMLKALAEVHTHDSLAYGAEVANERVTSLTMTQQIEEEAKFDGESITENDWMQELEASFNAVDTFTQRNAQSIDREAKQLEELSQQGLSEDKRIKRLAQVQVLGQRFIRLEKFVNLNYMGFHKILKKHDKLLPTTPCRDFYIKRMHQMHWVRDNYSLIFVRISRVLSSLRGDESGEMKDEASQEFVRKTTKYWIRTEDITRVKYEVLQHLPVFQFDQSVLEQGDAQLTNSVYLDNSNLELYHGRINKTLDAIAIRLRWYGTGNPRLVFVERKTHRDSWTGEESVKERFTLDETQVVPFLQGRYRVDEAVEAMRAKGKTEEEIAAFHKLFTECQRAIESKLLVPTMRTQYMRVAYQIPFDATVRVSLDTNLCMISENPSGHATCAEAGRWYRDPELPVPRTEITRFPHAVLEVKLALKEGQEPPPWVQNLIDSGMLCEVHKFSKFLHGCATLISDRVQEVPYWVDDGSIQTSMLRSMDTSFQTAPAAPGASKSRTSTPPRHSRSAHPASAAPSNRSFRLTQDDLIAGGGTHAANRSGGLQFMGNPGAGSSINGGGRNAPVHFPRGQQSSVFSTLLPCLTDSTKSKPRKIPMRIEPKTYFANERTFLSWLHMAVTLGSIGGFKFALDRGKCKEQKKWEQYGGVVMIAVAITFILYALRLYLWRGKMIRERRMGPFDDRCGPFVLALILFVAFGFILAINLTNHC